MILTEDVMFVNRTAFLIKLARKLKFAPIEHRPIQMKDQLSKSLNNVIKLYGRGGLVKHVILMDTESEKVAEKLVKV